MSPGGRRRSTVWTRLSRSSRLLFSSRPVSLATESVRIRLTLTLLACLVPLFLVMAVASAMARVEPLDAFGYSLGGGALVLSAVAARIAASGHQGWSARVLSAANIVLGVLVALSEHDPLRAAASGLFALVGVLWASFLLSPRDTTIIAVLAVVAMIVLPIIHPRLTAAQMVLPGFFLVFASTFVIVASYLNQRHLTDLERRNGQLAEGQQLLRVTMDSSMDAVVTCDERGRVRDWSRQAEVIFGISRDGALGRDVTELAFEPQDHAHVRDLIHELAKSPGAMRRTEVKARRQQGTVFPAELSASGLTLAGRPACAVFVRDISERRQMQAELLQTDRLVSMGRLAAGVAHEINNPMTYVLANLQFANELVEKAAPALGDDGRELAEVLADAAEGAGRVHTIVRELRTFTHDGAEERAPVDLAKVLDSAAHLAGNEIRHRAKLVKRYAEGVPPVAGNAARLGQVFLNLVVNAVQALPRDGREHEIRLILRQEGPDVVAEVSDTGPGIPPAVRERMFLPFVTTKRAGEGTGLGLYISRNIVGALGGDIRVTSEPGEGTTFSVVLPALQAVPRAPPSDPPPRAATAVVTDPPLSILLVDDDEGVRRTLQRTLAGHDLTPVASAAEALDACRARSFDLVLCDVMMPGMTGVELARTLFAENLVAEERLCFLTAGAFSPAEQDFLAKHAHRQLDKPVDLRRLNAVLERTAVRPRSRTA